MMNTPKIDDHKHVFLEEGDIAVAVNSWQGKMINQCKWAGFTLLLYSPAFYLISKNNLWAFIGWETVVTLLICCITYAQIFGKAQDFSKIATEVIFFKDEVLIKTTPFKVGILIDKRHTEIRLNRSDVSVYKIVNPYPYFFTLNKFVIRLKYGKSDEVYIIPEFFPEGLEAELRENAIV